MANPETSLLTPEFNDRDDMALRNALTDMQAIVSRHLEATRLSIDDMDETAQQKLVDKVAPYLGFELEQSGEIWMGMPFEASGEGGMLAVDGQGEVVGAQPMDKGDTVSGIVDDIRPLPVPSIECMRATIDAKAREVASFTQSFSAVVVLQNAKFYTPRQNGTISVHDLSHMRVAVPVIYGMQMSMAGKIDL